MIITTQTWTSVCCISSFRQLVANSGTIHFSISFKFAGHDEPLLHQLPTPCLAAKRKASSNGITRVPEAKRHCIERRTEASTPSWSGSWRPMPPSTRRTTMAVASELEKSTRILHKSVGIWPQNFGCVQNISEGLSTCWNSLKL